MISSGDRLTVVYVWRVQTSIPVVLRRTGRGERHRVKLPYASGNREWLQSLGRHRPVWIAQTKGEVGYWEIPKAWFNAFVDRSLLRWGKVYIIQPFREQEVCSPACQNATGHECQCSCMGEHHGMGSDGSWFEVSDTFSFRSGDHQLACRLLTSRA